MSNATVKITDIAPEQEPEAARLMARAFMGDPLMCYMFGSDQDGYTQRLRDFFRYTCAVHREMRWPLLGAMPRTRLAGVACVAAPEQPEWPDALTEAYTEFTADFDAELLDRIERYALLPSRNTPDAPQFYVKAIGVRPESHGQGYAHHLLDTVHTMAARHPTAAGVGLDTENPRNVSLYETLGYQLVETVPFDGIEVFYMFRPNDNERG